ncbi:hypothetical protein EUGRSUZ_G00630 [Eucalyptus grandis]|uniref:Uncharacterized protein n=2 Tax=Eucalyptus grandis TaxID=71139 RepID=A0ACC3K1M9_EUCGR|nr:hypothetical protein EUGRSUZ_G00630 [Eucalyptus grandis]
MTEGSLATLYHKYELRDSQVSEFTRQILNGLKYLHDQKVVHRDIKCANILVHASGSVKLADFGLAKATEMNAARTSIGSAFWMAPEVVNPKPQALYRIGRGKLPPVPQSLSSNARDFILKCLQKYPEDRPSAEELLGHPFVSKPPTTGFASPLFNDK